MSVPDQLTEQVLCTACEHELGEMVIVAGMRLFHAGGVVIREIRGWCAQCGQPFYWVASDNQIQVIIKGLRVGATRKLAKGKHG